MEKEEIRRALLAALKAYGFGPKVPEETLKVYELIGIIDGMEGLKHAIIVRALRNMRITGYKEGRDSVLQAHKSKVLSAEQKRSLVQRAKSLFDVQLPVLEVMAPSLAPIKSRNETPVVKDRESFIGKKVKGFEFETPPEGRPNWVYDMKAYVGETGRITRYSEASNSYAVNFGSEEWFYPADKVEEQLRQKRREPYGR